MALTALRASLGDAVQTADRDMVWLDSALITSDYFELLSLLETAKTEEEFAHALRLADGEFCAGLEGSWIQDAAATVNEKIAGAAISYLKLCAESGDFANGIDVGGRILRQVGCREDLMAALIELSIKAGFYALALSHYEALERELLEKWGQRPGQQTLALLDQIPVLPKQARAIVGRQEEFQELIRRFYRATDGHVVCLTGPGGIGKTTLAKAVLRELESAGQWVRFIDLTSANSFNSAIRTICTVLQLGEIDLNDAALTIAKTIVSKKGVVALDNLEQMGSEADKLVSALLRASNGVNLILTTRARIERENVDWMEIQPLSLPEQKASPDEVRMAGSAQLFEKRAAHVSPGFAVNRSNYEAVALLCQKLDGLPLALEIAAAKVVVQTPLQILEQIQKSFVSLEKKHGSKSARHSSINAAVNWSVGLLEEHEQMAALRLSLVNGQFNAKMAADIAESEEVLTILEVLVRASLLNSDSTGSETRFWMYETVRLSLQDIFRDNDAFVQARNRHFDVTIARLKEIRSVVGQPGWKTLQADLGACPDALDCMEFFIGRGERIEDSAETAVRIQEACRIFGLYDRNVKCMNALLGFWKDESLWALVGLAIVRSQANQGSEEEKLALLTKCENAAAGNTSALLDIKSQMAACYKSFGKFDESEKQMNWVAENCDETHPGILSWNLYQLNHNAFLRGDRVKTLYYLGKALDVAKRFDDVNRLIRILFDYGAELAFHGRFEESIEYFDEAISHCQRIRSSKMEGLTRWQYGEALIHAGRHREALEMLLKSVQLVYDANYQVAEKWIFLNASDAGLAVGILEPAARLFAKGLHIRRTENRPFGVSEEEDIDRVTKTLISKLGRGDFERLSAEGRDSEWPPLWAEMNAAFAQIEPV